MKTKIANRYRNMVFALIMSATTALIVSGILIYMRSESHANFILQWSGAFITTWPIVFVVILVIAPAVNKFLNLFVEEN
jgi:Protein of unknown function (DUF2798)